MFFSGSFVMRILSEGAVGNSIIKFIRISCPVLFCSVLVCGSDTPYSQAGVWNKIILFDSVLIFTLLVLREHFQVLTDLKTNPPDYTSLSFWNHPYSR